MVDIISALTDSPTPRQYWRKVKNREFVKLQLSPIWVRLKLLSPDGKMRQTDCVNTKGASLEMTLFFDFILEQLI